MAVQDPPTGAICLMKIAYDPQKCLLILASGLSVLALGLVMEASQPVRAEAPLAGSR